MTSNEAKGKPAGAEAGEARVPDVLPILPISEAVIFPYMMVPLVLSDRKLIQLADDCLGGGKILGAFAQRPTPDDGDDGDEAANERQPEEDVIYRVGTAVKLQKMLRFPDGSMRLLGQGVARVRLRSISSRKPYLKGRVEVVVEEENHDSRTLAYMRGVANNFMKIVDASENLSDELKVVVMNIDAPGRLADLIATNLDIEIAEKQQVLEEASPRKRLELLAKIVMRELEVVELGRKLQSRVRKSIDKDQREYYLRQQMKAIQRELGDTDEASVEMDELKERIAKAELPETARAAAEREYERLSRMSPGASEYTVSKTYVDWLLDLPWLVSSEDKLDLRRAEKILERDHYGLEDVKERILEFLAVRKLKEDNRGPILCLAGPPGVGKTSLGRSVAEAVGRKFVRFSLGGMRDEAEIRGHRRTYVGALPGRIIQTLRRVESRNPVIMLDELDKVGADFRGDPAAALLEVLDPAQNSTFTDHYLDLPFDLSRVLFITTANWLEPVHPALRDRLEVIELPSYTESEKLQIAKRYLVPRQLEEHGLTRQDVRIPDATLRRVIHGYTREAGVRQLEREIAALTRKATRRIVTNGEIPKPLVLAPEAVRDYLGAVKFVSETAETIKEYGIATGLAWTPVGGEILFIEATRMPGKGQLLLTGSLGDVMKESAQTAVSLLRSQSKALGLDLSDYSKYDLHIHIPAGATPKDGPSAGVTLLVALASLLSRRRVRSDVAMTGEISLRGRVMRVGGIKEKVLAAARFGIKDLILPEQNRPDWSEVPEEVRDKLKVHFVRHVLELLPLALREK